jgi:hypothetical protein
MYIDLSILEEFATPFDSLFEEKDGCLSMRSMIK